MSVIYTKLRDIVNSKTGGTQKLTVSEVIKTMYAKDEVIIGGEVKSVVTIFDDKPTMVIIDDGIGETKLELLPEVFKTFKERLLMGSIVICKGIIQEKKYIKYHPENRGEKSLKYVLCTAVTLIDD